MNILKKVEEEAKAEEEKSSRRRRRRKNKLKLKRKLKCKLNTSTNKKHALSNLFDRPALLERAENLNREFLRCGRNVKNRT